MPRPDRWGRPLFDRLVLAGTALAVILATGAVLRVVLYASFRSGAFAARDLALALSAGLVFDLLVGMLVLSPAALVAVFLRLRRLAGTGARAVLFGVLGAGAAFGAFVEWFFFSEFNARFNHIAVDYLLHQKEVVGNIWESYNVPLYVGLALVAGIATAFAGVRLTRGVAFAPLSGRDRLRGAAAVLGAATAAAGLLLALPSDVSNDRVVAEIAQNGLDRLVHAGLTGNLDFAMYYRSVPKEISHRRAASVLGFPVPSSEEATASGFRLVKKEGALPGGPKPWDVIVIVEESFGSEFVGVLGHKDLKATPAFDRWSGEGLLLDHLVANGDRTVRGLEGTLCSMVPLPGTAVLKRMKHREVATLAQVFRRDGYATAFVYGGWGVFDDMKPFFPENGFDEFYERDAFPKDAFTTAWGVADEWILGKVLERQREAAGRGEHVFITALTVSNHRPFDVPERHTSWPAARRDRVAAVAYADWAIGNYLDQAKAAGLLDHTVVLIVGDHGARIYGSEEIPVANYRIPALIVTPDPAWKGRRVERLCSQIDLAPTLLALTGREVSVPFLGESLLERPADGGRAFVVHGREVGILTDRALVTLGLQKKDTCYRRQGRDSDAFTRMASCATDPELQELEDSAAAVFGTAYDELAAGTFVFRPEGNTVAAARLP